MNEWNVHRVIQKQVIEQKILWRAPILIPVKANTISPEFLQNSVLNNSNCNFDLFLFKIVKICFYDYPFWNYSRYMHIYMRVIRYIIVIYYTNVPLKNVMDGFSNVKLRFWTLKILAKGSNKLLHTYSYLHRILWRKIIETVGNMR